MADSPHNFHYLLKPGNNFAFVAKFRTWFIVSMFLLAASVASLFVNKAVRGDYMNWTIDFKGGTEIIYTFKDKTDPNKFVNVEVGEVRAILAAADKPGIEVAEFNMTQKTPAGDDVDVPGVRVLTTAFGASSKEQRDQVVAAVVEQLESKTILKVTWSGDSLAIRSKQPITDAEIAAIFTVAKLSPKPLDEATAVINATADEGTGEYNATFNAFGLDRQFEEALEAKLSVDAKIETSHGVGAKAGDKLRNDGIKSLIYALGLIVLYLAFRFDIRYAPGAAYATLHDAIMVIGVFAVTWEEVSLTSVAALLTVIGFSVNDTVIVFDRIRENMAKHKDKKIERIVDISLNEVFVRSILTSLTLFATTLMMNIFGTGLVRNFAFAMNVGVIVGAYSSLFLATPAFLWVAKRWYTSSGPVRGRAEAVAAEP